MVRKFFCGLVCVSCSVFVFSLVGCGGSPGASTTESMSEEEFESGAEQDMINQMKEMAEPGADSESPAPGPQTE